MDMVQNARIPTDLGYVYDLTLTLIQYGADPNVNISTKYDVKEYEDYEPMDSYSHNVPLHGNSNNSGGKHGLGTNRPGTNYVLYYYVQLLMSKDKLISKDNNSSFRGGGGSSSTGTTICNYNDANRFWPGSYQGQSIGGGGICGSSGRELGGGNMSMGGSSSYASGGSMLASGSSNTDGIGNNSKSQSESPDMMHFARIIRLYYMVMYHVPLYSCLKLLYAHLNPNNPNKSALYNVIRDLCSKPRTLKQMSRVIIYNAVGQRPALTVNKLPLPTALREYVLSFEP